MHFTSVSSTITIFVVCIIVCCNVVQARSFDLAFTKRVSQIESIISAEKIVLGGASSTQLAQLNQNLPICLA